MLDVVDFNVLTAIKAAPVEAVKSTAMAGSKGMLDLSFMGLFMQADIVVKSVMIILILASVWSWAIIFNKWFDFKTIKSKSKGFEKAFWSGEPLENLFSEVGEKEKHPLAQVFTSAMNEWKSKNVKEITTKNHMRAGTKERIYQAMQVSSNKSIDSLENNLNFLATVGSSAPFIGLFGTVWGIMTSFQAIAISKNTTLAVVAPGIAEALLATAFGLAAAIPAVIFYNKFAGELNKLGNKLDDFSNELGAIISKELDSI